jgi:hypothetical protein
LGGEEEILFKQKNGECDHRASAEAFDDYKSKRVGRIVQAAALPFLRTLDSLDTFGVRLDNQHLDQTTVAGKLPKSKFPSQNMLVVFFG